MKNICAFTLGLIFTGSVLAADVKATDEVKAAISKIQTSDNYSWTTTLQMPDMPFTPGPMKGKSQKEGFSSFSQNMNDTIIEAVLRGDRIALKNDGKWQLIDEADGMAAMMGGWMTANGTATDEATKLISSVNGLTAGESNMLSGDLSAESAKNLMSFHPRGANGGMTPPTPKNARGSVKFWLKDGVLVKFESHLQGTLAFGDQGDHDMDITRTTEIQDVGTTKVEVSDDAKAILEEKSNSANTTTSVTNGMTK